MRFFYFSFFAFQFLLVTTVYGQWNNPSRYQTTVFGLSQLGYNMDVQFAEPTDILGVSRPLKLDVFYPKLSEDGIQNRPLIVMVHGGGFVGGSKNETMIFNGVANNYDLMAAQWASMGYVVATIDYRLYNNSSVYNTVDATWLINHFKKDNTNLISEYSALYWYVAMQDLNAAIKYLCYHSSAYGIDPQQVYLFGESAGAVTVATFGVSYRQQYELNQCFPFTSFAKVGDLNYSVRPQYQTQSFTVRGVAPVAGLIADERLFTVEDAVPFFMEHNILDPIVSPLVDGKLKRSIGSQRIMERIRGWVSSGRPYPCSNFYYTYDGTYDYGGAGSYHTLSANATGWSFFRTLMAEFNNNIIRNNGACVKDRTLYRCYMYSSNLYGPRLEEQETLTAYHTTVLGAYPIPSSEEVTLTGLTEGVVTTVAVYDAQGTLVSTKTLHTAATEYEKTLSIESLKPGVYSIHVMDEMQQNRYIKIVKQ